MEKKPSAIRNYGIVLRYLSRTLNINMYREYRDTTLSNAISQMCKTQNLLFSGKLDLTLLSKATKDATNPIQSPLNTR